MGIHTREGRSSRASWPVARWWVSEVTAGVDHQAVVQKVYEDLGWSAHFFVMTLLSAGIAILGLLLSSPAVVIGAMLISPLMGPIIGLGFGIATFDWQEIRRTLALLVIGVLLALLFCALIVLLSPLQTVTTEISSRTRPNLFDLLVALFSGLAGTYAMIRGRHGAIVGVAIATALMPPLAVMGFGLATGDAHVLAGSGLLFFTNLVTISAAAAVLARLYGFAANLSPHQTRVQALLIILVLIALALPLGLALRQIAREALVSREASAAVAAAFPTDARVNDLKIDFDARPVEFEATVITPEYRTDAEHKLQSQLADLIGKPIVLSLDQVRAVHGDAAVAMSTASAGERAAARVAERLALVAGVQPGDVLVDRVAHRAVVRAAPLAGADMATYRTLEQRVAASESGWDVTLVPPVIALPEVRVADGAVDEAAVQTAIWAGQRLQMPIGVSADKPRLASAVVEELTAAGVKARVEPGPGSSGAVSLRWLGPEELAAPAAAPAQK
ncbi:MAG TPA: DUF389 domain-containing protein [Acidobacteriaceae bacterium]|nr:DUF389 domain-containing protein [Acidobacteriaceae bacterium]